MEFTKIFACLIAVAVPRLCDTVNFPLGTGFTGGLIGGPVVGRPGFGPVGQLGGLGCNCPLGTVCDIQLGLQRCLPVAGGLAGPVGIGGAIGVGGPIVGGGYDGIDGFGNPIIGGYGRGLIGGIRRRCGYMSRACRASRFDRYRECKYTFDHRRHRCVQVHVCNSCRFANGPDANLFDSMYDCEHYCH